MKNIVLFLSMKGSLGNVMGWVVFLLIFNVYVEGFSILEYSCILR